jgi:hypothetical protein
MCNRSNIEEYSELCLGDNPPADCYPNYNTTADSMFIVFLVLNMFIGLAGNLLTLLAIPYAKYRKRFGFSGNKSDTTSLYILNLAFCDFLFCAAATPFSVMNIFYRGWPYGQTLCIFSAWFRWTMTGADWEGIHQNC